MENNSNNNERNERSPSPQPIYDSKRVRINTWNQRYNQKLEQIKSETISQLTKIDPTFQVLLGVAVFMRVYVCVFFFF